MAEKQHEFDILVARAADEAAAVIHRHAVTIQDSIGLDPVSAYQHILSRLRNTDNGMTADGRAGWWRVRCRLYTQDDGYSEPLADSDPDKPLEDAGSTLLMTLPAVIEWTHALARGYHGDAVITGLDKISAERRIKSFRTNLSLRKDGLGTLQLNYQVTSARKYKPLNTMMRASVDIRRELRSDSAEIQHQNRRFRVTPE